MNDLGQIADLSSVIGLAVSVVALGITIYAARQAIGARKAAESASVSIRHRDTAEELNALVSLAGQAMNFIQDKDHRGAALRVADLHERLTIAKNRRARFLNNPAIDIDLTLEQLSSVRRSIATSGIPADPAAFSKLFKRCQEAHTALSQLSGAVQLNIEDNENEHD